MPTGSTSISIAGAGTGATWVTNSDHALSSDEKLMALLATFTPIRLPDTLFSQKLTWCLENCTYKFRDIVINHERIWYFEQEKDATLFSLKWT